MADPLRVLVCIPHFFRRADAAAAAAGEGAQNGSTADTAQERAEVLAYCLQHLGAQLRRTSFLIGSSGEQDELGREVAMDRVELVRPSVVGQIDIQCVPQDNLLDRLPMAFARSHLCSCHPRLLGYRCRARFLEQVENYDLFCFLEDDTAILDPRFFLKVRGFYDRFGEDRIVLPSRYELVGRGDSSFHSRLDGALPARHRVPLNMAGPAELVADSIAGAVRFVLTRSVMAGCYVLTPSQVRRWAQQPDFGQPMPELLARGFDPLEMTQIPLMGALPIYRPAPEHAGFLEVHHVPNRLSNARAPFSRISALLHGRDLHLPV